MTLSESGAAHPLDQALVLAPLAPHRFSGQPHPAYANMVGPYGGITAAQMLQAVLQHPERLGEPVALTVNYAAALLDRPFEIEARPARTNRSTQHWTLLLRQPDEDGTDATVITATALTAVRRSTWSASDVALPTDLARPQDVAPSGRPPQVRWPGRYDMRLITGHMPVTWDGSEADSLTRLWVRDEPPRALDFASLTALADVFYPRVWRRRALRTPAGTVSMTVYYHAGGAELAATGAGYLLAQARSQAFFNGFFDQSAELWNEAGHLLATTHQIVYFKE